MQQFIMALGSNCTNHKQALLTVIPCKEIKIIHRKKSYDNEIVIVVTQSWSYNKRITELDA